MHVEVAESADQLAAVAAGSLARLLAATPATLGLAGGSTPVATYHVLAERDFDWAGITCWLADERWVPPDDLESNTRMVRSELTDRTGAPLIVPDTTVGSPAEAAAAYWGLLDTELADRPGVVLLGIGPDGHTASLFPGTTALEVSDATYVANWVDALGSWRLTATVPFLHTADHLVFLASGSGKAPVLREILVENAPYPAGLVAQGARDVTWLLDAEAAALL